MELQSRGLLTTCSARIRMYISSLNSFWFTLLVALTAFMLYTCVYAFRKTFAAATFGGVEYFGINYKVLLVIFQVFGYALSKFVGIKIIAELTSSSRARGILYMSLIAGGAWLLFGFLDKPFNVICLLVNGMSLGLIWGMVFGYLEGRTTTDVLGAILSVSFIFSSGLCRTVGAFLLLHMGITERWMPFVASLLFLFPLLIALLVLDSVPPPNHEDEALRTRRKPMSKEERASFLKMFLPGIVMFITAYLLLTTFRDFRDNFSADVWKELGFAGDASIYTKTEIPISILVLCLLAFVMLTKNNRRALILNHIVILLGLIIVGVSTYLFENAQITPFVWMTSIGLGLYMGYVPFNSIFFDRLIATFKVSGTVGFIMYVSDAFGYLGSVVVLFIKEFYRTDISWLSFLTTGGYTLSIAGFVAMSLSLVYFESKFRKLRSVKETERFAPDSY